MSFDQLDEDAKNLLLHLYRQTGGKPSVQVSMYEAGASLGLDREAASRAAEDLIGWEMVELRTLSGGIGISDKAVQEIEDSGLAGPNEPGSLAAFGKDVIIDADARQVVEQIVSDVKNRAGSLGLDFDRLSEVMTDLKTIDAQLDSPRPKTTIVRECFRSLKAALDGVETGETVDRIGKLLKE
jgi:hypothetical protein